MIQQEPSNLLRSKVIDFLNKDSPKANKKLININAALNDEQKMIILKKLISENDKYKFDLTYNLKNYQKSPFLPHNELLYSNQSQQINEVGMNSKTENDKNFLLKQGSYFYNSYLKKQSNPLEKNLTSQSQIISKSISFNNNRLNFTQNQNDHQNSDNSKIFEQFIYPQDDKYSNDDYKEGKEMKISDQVLESYKVEHTASKRISTPLVLTKRFKELFKKSKNIKENISVVNNSQSIEGSQLGSTSMRKTQNSSQSLFNQIRYKTINKSQDDPFTDEIDEYSQLKQRKNQEILQTKISNITPPSNLHFLVKRNNTYFFERSSSYKREFSVTPSKNVYLRENTINSQDNNSVSITNLFYDATKCQDSTNGENSFKEKEEKEIELSEKSHKIQINQHNKNKSKQNLSRFSQKNNNRNEQQQKNKNLSLLNYSGLNTTAQKSSIFSGNQKNLNQELTSLHLVSQQSNPKQDINNSSFVKQQDIENLQTEETHRKKQDDSTHRTQNILSSSRKIIDNQLPRFSQLQHEAERRASIQIDSQKMFSPSQIELLQSLRKLQNKQNKNIDSIDSRKESIQLQNLSEFQFSNINDKIIFDRFIFNIGENEKNIQDIITENHTQRRKSTLPKIKIVRSSQIFENPAPGHYNVNLSSFQTNRGLTFTKINEKQPDKTPKQIDQKTPVYKKEKQPIYVEETSERYFQKLMKEVKREVERETRQAGQTLLKANSIQELNSIDQIVFDRYSNDMVQRLIQCKKRLTNMKKQLKKDDLYKNM